MNTDGIITRDGKRHIITVGDKVKVFENKVIYLPEEYELAIANHLTTDKLLVIGGTGYSSIREEHLNAWGIDKGQYEDACYFLLRNIVSAIQVLRAVEHPQLEIKIVHGASAMGVDNALMKVAREHANGELGFSCPEYMLYVDDDDYPVYCAPNKLMYSDRFIESLNILVAMNGRDHAFINDMLTAVRYDKRLILLNVIGAIATRGRPAARSLDGKIEDAVTAFLNTIETPEVVAQHRKQGYSSLVRRARKQAHEYCESLLEPATV